jgi:hypothetical protein
MLYVCNKIHLAAHRDFSHWIYLAASFQKCVNATISIFPSWIQSDSLSQSQSNSQKVFKLENLKQRPLLLEREREREREIEREREKERENERDP